MSLAAHNNGMCPRDPCRCDPSYALRHLHFVMHRRDAAGLATKAKEDNLPPNPSLSSSLLNVTAAFVIA